MAAMPDQARAERQRRILADRFEVPFVQDAVRLCERVVLGADRQFGFVVVLTKMSHRHPTWPSTSAATP